MKSSFTLGLLMTLMSVGCSRFSALPNSALTLSQSSDASSGGSGAANSSGALIDCGDSRLMGAFSQTYWTFTKSRCVSCHGAGVSGRAFASENLAEAYNSFQSPSTSGFKEVRLRENAVNPLHGSPNTNGTFNVAVVDQAAAEFARLRAEICASKATPTPAPGSTPVAGSTPAPGSTPVATATPIPTAPGDASSTALGIVTQANLFATYKNLTGTDPSAETKRKIYDDPRIFVGIKASRRYLMPPSAKTSAYTSGTLMISMITATEHCRDLVEKEKSISSSQRRFFVGVDFTKSNLQAVSSSQVTDIGNALGKSFWFRSLTSAEASSFQNFMTELNSQNLTPSQAMTMVCTLALTSLSSNVR